MKNIKNKKLVSTISVVLATILIYFVYVNVEAASKAEAIKTAKQEINKSLISKQNIDELKNLKILSDANISDLNLITKNTTDEKVTIVVLNSDKAKLIAINKEVVTKLKDKISKDKTSKIEAAKKIAAKTKDEINKKNALIKSLEAIKVDEEVKLLLSTNKALIKLNNDLINLNKIIKTRIDKENAKKSILTPPSGQNGGNGNYSGGSGNSSYNPPKSGSGGSYTPPTKPAPKPGNPPGWEKGCKWINDGMNEVCVY